MSQHYGDYEDLLRGALHAAVDSAEPADDGLERIRARLATPRPLPVAWLMAVCSWVARRARGSLDSVSAWLQTVPGEIHRRGGAAEGQYTQRLGLVATVAAVTALLAISVSALTPFGRHVISQAGSALTSMGGGEPAGTGERGASGQDGGGAGVTGATNGGQNHAQPAASCTPGASALAVPPARTSPAGPSPAGTSPASPSSPASTAPASPSAASTGPASPPTAGTGPASPSSSSPPQSRTAQVPSPSASPSPSSSTSASVSAASPSSTTCESPAPSPSPSSPTPGPPSTSAPPASPPAASTPPASAPPAGTAPASAPPARPGPSRSSAVNPAGA